MSTTELAAQSTPSTDQTLANAIDQPLRSSTDRPIDSAYLRTGVAVAPYAGERVRTIRKARRRPVADAAGTMDEVLPATDDPLSGIERRVVMCLIDSCCSCCSMACFARRTLYTNV